MTNLGNILFIYKLTWLIVQRSRPMKGQNRPNKMGKIELKFWQIIFYMKDRAYVMVYVDDNF
jgi:hypothetical protein